MKKRLVLVLCLLMAVLLIACEMPEPVAPDNAPPESDPANVAPADAVQVVYEYLNYGRCDELAVDAGFEVMNAWMGYEEGHFHSGQLANLDFPDELDPDGPPLLYAIFEIAGQIGLERAALAIAADIGNEAGEAAGFAGSIQDNQGMLFPGVTGPLAVLCWLNTAEIPQNERGEALSGSELEAQVNAAYWRYSADPAGFVKAVRVIFDEGATAQQETELRAQLAQQIYSDMEKAYYDRISYFEALLQTGFTVQVQEKIKDGEELKYTGYGVFMTLADGAAAPGLPVGYLDEQGIASLEFTVEQFLLAGGPEQIQLFAPGQKPGTDQPELTFIRQLKDGENEISFSSSAPALEDIAGHYEVNMVLSEFHISKPLGDLITEEDYKAIGCDSAMQQLISNYVDKDYPLAGNITWQDQEHGVAILVNEPGATIAMDFLYEAGEMVFKDVEEENLLINGVWTVEMLPEGGYGFSGQLIAAWPEDPEGLFFRLDFTAEPQD